MESSNDTHGCPDASELLWPEDADQELLKALDAEHPERRAAALTYWREIARGQIYAEGLFFMRYVACEVVKADRADAKKRAGELVKALGLHGPSDPWRYVRVRAAALRDFGATREEIIDHLEALGLLDADDLDARSLLDRELRKAPRPMAAGRSRARRGSS